MPLKNMPQKKKSASGSELPWYRRIGEAVRRIFAVSSKRYLCDSCKWDYGNACKRPERPNALKCPDYKAR